MSSCSFSPSILSVWADAGASSSASSGSGSSSSSQPCPYSPYFLGFQNFTLTLPWGDVSVLAEANFTGSSVDITFQGTGISHTESMKPRWRREYGDYTLTETANFTVTMNGPDGQVVDVTFDLSFEPTCRKFSASFAGECGTCFDETLYNVIDLASLPKYPLTKEKCPGKPIDIDVVCKTSVDGNDPGGDEKIEGGVTMYYTPYPNTVPVVNNIAYDTTNLPAPPAGKINVVKITKQDTRNNVRSWVCSNLKFSTIKGHWPPAAGSSSSAGGFPADGLLEFNWPFNDLYFSKGCPGGDTVNLVPC